MQVTYRLMIDDVAAATERRFAYRADVPYPHAPRIGEAVVLPTSDPGFTLGARKVEDVIYTPDGGILLDFRVDGLVNPADVQVEAVLKAGYYEL